MGSEDNPADVRLCNVKSRYYITTINTACAGCIDSLDRLVVGRDVILVEVRR